MSFLFLLGLLLMAGLGMVTNNGAAPEPIMVTRREAAKLLSCCERTVAELAKAGAIEEIRHGRFIRYPVASLNAMSNKSTGGEG